MMASSRVDEDLPAGELDAIAETCWRLKRRLVLFTVQRFPDEIRASALEQEDSADVNLVIDDLIHARSLPGTASVIDTFLAEMDDLTQVDRHLVRGWKDGLIGVFEITGRTGRLVRARNLVDDLDFRLLVTSADPALLARFVSGAFVLSRAVPLGTRDLWMFSGSQSLLAAGEEVAACDVAIHLAFRNPEWYYRNPSNLERARQLTRKRFDAFVARNGRPWFTGTPDEVCIEVEAFNASGVDSTISGGRGRPSMGRAPAAFSLPEPLLREASVSIFLHPSIGTVLFGGTALLTEAFDRPELAGSSPWNDQIRNFLSGAGVAGCRALEGIGAWSPARAGAIFREFTGRTDFDWSRDGAELLQSFTPELAGDPGWPTELAVSERVARALMTGAGVRSAKRPAFFGKRASRKRGR